MHAWVRGGDVKVENCISLRYETGHRSRIRVFRADKKEDGDDRSDWIWKYLERPGANRL